MDWVFLSVIAAFFLATVALIVGCAALERVHEARAMNPAYVVSGVIALGLLVYLVIALLRAEEL